MSTSIVDNIDYKATGLCVGFVVLCKILLDLTDAVNKSVNGKNVEDGGSTTSRSVATKAAPATETISPSDKRSKRGENLYGKAPKVCMLYSTKNVEKCRLLFLSVDGIVH